MDNENIKEILKKIKSVSNFDDYVDFIGTEFKPLLDYITNLQEENERLRGNINNAKEFIEQHRIREMSIVEVNALEGILNE